MKQIVEEMVAGTWTAKRAVELGADWGLAVSTVQNYSAEASRQVRATFGDAEERRAIFDARIDATYGMAKAAKDSKAAVSVLALEAKVRGYEAPAKVAVTDVKGDDVPAEFAALLADRAALARMLLDEGPKDPEKGSDLHTEPIRC